ncbi:hypothetical protein FNV43_RR15464 [Rhamnella rubrinervis]|uniref:Uncharacterized protein n=1 Tax=Rhamnella rubrinervis TaxID=2594499 RepID=A0A8K0GYB7_9ROSA|nr:hypothetical protein FNV43_RR15464 [Rhamnella rubrinervis]
MKLLVARMDNNKCIPGVVVGDGGEPGNATRALAKAIAPCYHLKFGLEMLARSANALAYRLCNASFSEYLIVV